MNRYSSSFLRWNDRVLHRFADSELERCLRSDLYCLAGSRIATHACFAMGQDDLAKSRQYEFAILLDLAARERGQLVEHLFHNSAFQFELVSEVIDYLGLTHTLT